MGIYACIDLAICSPIKPFDDKSDFYEKSDSISDPLFELTEVGDQMSGKTTPVIIFKNHFKTLMDIHGETLPDFTFLSLTDLPPPSEEELKSFSTFCETYSFEPLQPPRWLITGFIS